MLTKNKNFKSYPTAKNVQLALANSLAWHAVGICSS
jgi:hypothetical protein